MYKLIINEYQFQNCTLTEHHDLKSMAQDFAELQGIDWEYEYRWMTMTPQSLMLAKIKYPHMDKIISVRSI